MGRVQNAKNLADASDLSYLADFGLGAFSVKFHPDFAAMPLDSQCPRCGARSRLTPVRLGVNCGVCGTLTFWQ